MSLERSVWINAKIDTVRSYFTDAAKMSAWCGQDAEINAVVGGIYRLDMGLGGWLEGRFTEVEDRRLGWEIDLPDDQPPSRIVVTFLEEVGGTRVTVIQTGLPTPFGLIAGRGWDHHLARLSVATTGGHAGPDSLCERKMLSLA